MNSGHRVRRKNGTPIAHSPVAVRKAREDARLTQARLAKLVGISHQLMCDIEAGRRNATPPVLYLIAKHTKSKVKHLRASTPVQACA